LQWKQSNLDDFMPKDIFIDNTVAKNFSNPLDPSYKRLVAWLIRYDPAIGVDNAHLVWSRKILAEYNRTAANSRSDTNIAVIIDKLTREGRHIFISNPQIKEFKRGHFKKRILRQLRCNAEDRDHIPVVLLSDRKYALSTDHRFVHDINNFPGFVAQAATRPENLPYDA
jgi:hypothetical protein